MKIPEGFIEWKGGECHVPNATVDVHFRNGEVVRCGVALTFDWRHSGGGNDIIAYRVIEEEKPKVKIPEGFTPWAGGECPVQPDTRVDVVSRYGQRVSTESKSIGWLHTGLPGDIIAYRVIEEEKPTATLPQRARDIQAGGDHYKKVGVQPWDVVDTWPLDQQIGFHRGNALKYVMRLGTKDESVQEIRKAAHYLQKLVEVLEQKGCV